PHQSKYYQGEGVPADWNKPVPVPFLTVEKGTAYRFWLGPGDRARTSWPADLDQLRSLLTVALDLLGIGGKKAAGYGVFGTQKPALPAAGSSQAGAAPSPNTATGTKEWKDVELRWHRGAPAAFRGNDTATGSEDVLPVDLLEALKSLKKKKGKLVGTVEVRKFLGTEWRIVAVTGWRLSDK
ncbi:MAG TPA: type III-B CRISPR module RAMP protein Cmr6, partial [Thermoanaerobaculia bacterium]